jgi:hypothetical protein
MGGGATGESIREARHCGAGHHSTAQYSVAKAVPLGEAVHDMRNGSCGVRCRGLGAQRRLPARSARQLRAHFALFACRLSSPGCLSSAAVLCALLVVCTMRSGSTITIVGSR